MRFTDPAHIEVVCSAPTLVAFEEMLDGTSPEALLLELDALGEDPVGGLQRLQAKTASEVTLVVYFFAKKALLRQLSELGAKLVRGPVQLDALRHHFLRFIVRDLLSGGGRCTCPGRVERSAQVVRSALEALEACPVHQGAPRGPLEGALRSVEEARAALKAEAKETPHG